MEAWISQNPNHPIYSQCLEAFELENEFCYQMLVKQAHKQRLNPLEFMRLPKFSTAADLSGFYSEIEGLMREPEGYSLPARRLPIMSEKVIYKVTRGILWVNM